MPMGVGANGDPVWRDNPTRLRPRRDCPACGRQQVAVMADGTLWWHKWPGWGLWSDGGDCKGAKA